MNAEGKRARVCVVGLGYIGLPTAVVLAQATGGVAGYEIDERKRHSISLGCAPIVEVGLNRALKEAVNNGALKITDAIPQAKTYILAVPTPLGSDKKADLSFLRKAVLGVSSQLVGDELIIIESTIPPGVTQYVRDLVFEARPDLDRLRDGDSLKFAYCPERVLPGRILDEITTNDRIIGGLNRAATLAARDLYQTFCKGAILLTDAKTAEITKLAENSFRDINIAFANELEDISTSLGVDVWEVISLANHHPRVNILQPGPGVGGHCIAIDPWFLSQAASVPARMIETAREINNRRPAQIARRVLMSLPEGGRVRILVLGITFKENVDDIRQSPAISVVAKLATARPDAEIVIVDPLAQGMPEELDQFHNISFVAQLPSVTAGYDAVVALVAHDQFSQFARESFGDAIVIDTRGML